MTIFDIINLLGGLALFLYGMTLMGDSLKKVAGSKLESVLEKLTSNRLLGVLLGIFVTAIIQSSSATTVMVVGFVNSGIMKLSQAIGVIMGANIGTTATGWILTLSGVEEGETTIASLFSAATFTPIIALIGVGLYMFAKRQKTKHVGGILMGFAVLMFGMQFMSGAVSGLKESEAFASILKLFSNPLLGILVGIVFTAIIQSSSASVGVLQALSVSGTITYATAMPLILGMNIGACAPVLLSAIGANKNGKRTALVYLYYNILGTAAFLVVYYLAGLFINFTFPGMVADTVGIAILNTVYKVFATVVLIPFTGFIQKLVCLTVRDRKNDDADAVEMLDERFLNYPPLAAERCRVTVNRMADIAHKNILCAIDLLDNWDDSASAKIRAKEDVIDLYEDKLGTYLVKLSTKELSDKEVKSVSRALHGIGDIERIGDHAINILETAEEIHDKKIVFSEQARCELAHITCAVREILNMSFGSYIDEDIATASKVESLEEVVDMLRTELKTRHIDRLQKRQCTLEIGFVFNDLLSNYERVADHCSNLAACVVALSDDSMDTHEYLKKFKEEDGSFLTGVEHYKKVYFDTVDSAELPAPADTAAAKTANDAG